MTYKGTHPPGEYCSFTSEKKCYTVLGYKLKLAAPARNKGFYFYLTTFFLIYCNKRLLRQKTGGACLYMPQDGHWLASFEVIPPPKKVSFSAAEK